MKLENNLDFWRKNIQGDSGSKCEDPKAGTGLECSKTSVKWVWLELMEPGRAGDAVGG